MSRMKHVLPDVLGPGLRVVFCGSAVGPESFRRQAYYAHPRNRFWATLHEIGLTPRRFAPQEYRQLKELGIGLTDLAKHRHGMDTVLKKADYDADALTGKIMAYQPQVLAFVGKKPGGAFMARKFGLKTCAYGLQARHIDATALFILPSPSPANPGHWDVQPWRDLASFLKRQ